MSDNNKGRGIFYGVIGVATLVVAIIGATFAYFTATAANTATIKGNTAKVQLSLAVTKISNADETKGGMIPLANSMVQRAVYGTDSVKKTVLTGASADICVDDNGNAVCQIYQITLNNESSTGVFVDGYVSLKGGSGTPNDYTYSTYGTESGQKKNKFKLNDYTAPDTSGFNTTMRWAQLIKNDTDSTYSTAGDFQLGLTDTEKVTFNDIGVASDTTGANAKNTDNIRDQYTASTNAKGVYGNLAINGTDTYYVINKNYIRVSDHDWGDGSTAETYDRTADVTSALVYNHYLQDGATRTYYIVVWLTENGQNQTAGQDGLTPAAANFFAGNVTFVSSQGNEVSATFQSYARVQSNNGPRQ